MKKTLSIILTIMLIILCCLFSGNKVQAASVSVTSSNANPKVGTNVTVTVRFPQPVSTAEFSLNYDSSVLQYVSNSIGGTNSGSSVAVYYIDVINLKTISSATFTFKTKKAGTANCSISGLLLSDAKGKKISATAGSTSIKVSNPSTSSGGSTNKPSDNNNQTNNKPSDNNNNQSSNKDPKFSNVNQKVYAKSQVNVRSSWSTSSRILGTLQAGDAVTRTGIGSNGWDKVTYRGQTGYISTSYLTTTKPNDDKKDDEKKDDENKNNVANNETNKETNNEENNEAVNNTENNNVSNEQTNTLENEIQQGNIVNDVKDEEEKGGFNFIIIGVIVIIVIGIIAIVVFEIFEKKKNKKNTKAKYTNRW